MFNGSVWTGVDARAAFDAVPYFFCDRFSVNKFKDFHGACGDAFTGALTFVVIDGDSDVSFLEFFFHKSRTSVLFTGGNNSYYFIVLVSCLWSVKKYQGFFIKHCCLKNQKANQTLDVFVLREGLSCYNELVN
jgi:hypothetical protein